MLTPAGESMPPAGVRANHDYESLRGGGDVDSDGTASPGATAFQAEEPIRTSMCSGTPSQSPTLPLRSRVGHPCKNAGIIRGASYVDGLAGTSSQDNYMGKASGGLWWHVNTFRLRYFANCNVATTCNGCKASCAITYDLWDSWHWGAAPGTSCGGFNQFNWHVTWYCVDFISSPCSDEPVSSNPTSQVGASR